MTYQLYRHAMQWTEKSINKKFPDCFSVNFLFFSFYKSSFMCINIVFEFHYAHFFLSSSCHYVQVLENEVREMMTVVVEVATTLNGVRRLRMLNIYIKVVTQKKNLIHKNVPREREEKMQQVGGWNECENIKIWLHKNVLYFFSSSFYFFLSLSLIHSIYLISHFYWVCHF